MLLKLAKNYFYKNRIHVFVLFFLLLISFLSAAFFAGLLNKQQRGEEIMEYVDHSVETLDQAITDDLYNFMEVNLQHYLRPSTFGQFFTNNSADDDFLVRTRISAIDSMRLQKNLKSLILYRFSDSLLLSTLSVRSDFTAGNPAYSYVAAAINSAFAYQAGFFNDADGEILYYYPLYGKNASHELTGCAMVQLRFPEEFFQIHVQNLNPKGTFLILNNGQIFSVEGYNILSNEIIESILQEAPPLGRIFTYDNADIATYTFYCAPSTSGMQYVYYEPANTDLMSFAQLLKKEWFISFLLTCATAFLFFLASAHQVSKVQQKLKPVAETDEPSALSSASCFSGILIEYRLTSDNQDSARVQTLISSSCAQHLSGCQISYKIVLQPLCVLCYISYSEYNMRVLTDSLKQILYNSIENCQFNLYYTTALNSFDEMQNEMHYLRSYLHYTQAFGYEKRFSIDFIRACNTSTEAVATDITSTIRKFLNEKQFHNATAYLEENQTKILESLHSSGTVTYSYQAIYHFMESSFFALKSFFLEKSYPHPITSLTMLHVLQAHTGVKAFLDFLIQIIQEYQETSEPNVSVQEKRFIEAIYLYIDQNLASVTLNSMAEHFHITSAHLSRMFKKNAGQNFSEYLSEKKLQKAIEFLEKEEKMNINEISHALGYSTPAYFLTKFKERYGTTPTAYRKSYLTKTAQEIPSAQTDRDME